MRLGTQYIRGLPITPSGESIWDLLDKPWRHFSHITIGGSLRQPWMRDVEITAEMEERL